MKDLLPPSKYQVLPGFFLKIWRGGEMGTFVETFRGKGIWFNVEKKMFSTDNRWKFITRILHSPPVKMA
jgi:hypothetical protein